MIGSKMSILDLFGQIRNENKASKPDLCVSLWNHLASSATETGEVDENGIPMEIRYSIKRLIQGLGSSRAPVRKSYFATLVSLLRKCDFISGSVSLGYFKELVDAQLSKFESKGEEGEVLCGRILAYGVAMRSKIFLNGTVELQQAILTEMLKKSKERSYLPLMTYTFITDFIYSIDEDVFKTVVWPILVNEVMVGWSCQSFETLYCLLQVKNKYPNILKKKQILSTFGTISILHEETIENIQQMLINITWEPCLKHPLYETIGRCLSENEDYELLDKFWLHIEKTLTNSPTRLKILAAFTIFGAVVKHVQLKKIPDLLTCSLVDNIVRACRPSVNKTDELSIVAKSTLQLIVTKVMTKADGVTAPLIYRILCKLTFESRHILIDKSTSVKVVFPCVSKLDMKHVKLVAKKCENVIYLKFNRKEEKTGVQHRWNYKERCYATHLLARLISHPHSSDMDWKIKHLKLMMRHALFTSKGEDCAQISNELATVLKNSFFTALSHQLSHLENHRMVLISLVFYIDNILTTGEYELRTKVSNEVLAQWKDTMAKIYKIDGKINKTAKKKTVIHIFHTLFLQMALHLFVDPVVAKNVLIELNRCYKKEKAQLNKYEQEDNDGAEPKWIEMAVELFLSLLSHDTYLLRQLISRMFPHLCQYLTAQATFQILQVFDPSSNDTILTEDNADSDGESSTSEDENEEETNRDSSILENNSEEESDSEIEDVDDMEETAIERTRQAVRDALGMAGSVTDTESIDLDDIDEEDGRKLDAALSQAFKNVQKSPNNKNKKQSANDKALTNFRIRVLDLVDIYLDNNPPLSLVLDTIPVLFKLLEFSIKDSHQKPLENRTRSTIKKIGHLKKCNNVAEVDENLLVDVLKSLMDKGVRSTPVFLGLCHEMSECCTFLLRMHTQRTNNADKDESSSFYDTIITSVENFFMKRDCLLPISLFENLLFKTNWIMNAKLCERILELSFDATVRGYRRNQGLSLLGCFYRNTRLLLTLKMVNSKMLAELEDNILRNAVKILKPKSEAHGNLKPTFISELFLLLYSVKTSKFCAGSSEWTKLGNIIRSFLNNGASSSNISRKYVVKLCSALRINSKIEQGETSTKRKNSDTELRCNNMVNDAGKSSCEVDNTDESGLGSEQEMNNDDSVLNSKNIIKKKKSKRKCKKTDEYRKAKRLRNEIANDVEVLKFSETNLSESL